MRLFLILCLATMIGCHTVPQKIDENFALSLGATAENHQGEDFGPGLTVNVSRNFVVDKNLGVSVAPELGVSYSEITDKFNVGEEDLKRYRANAGVRFNMHTNIRGVDDILFLRLGGVLRQDDSDGVFIDPQFAGQFKANPTDNKRRFGFYSGVGLDFNLGKGLYLTPSVTGEITRHQSLNVIPEVAFTLRF